MTAIAIKVKRPARPKWHRVYYLLALFDVLVVSTSLYLGHQMMDIYTRSVAENQEWAERRTDYSELGLLAGAVNAPGNDVFDSHDVEAESEKRRTALRIFDQRIVALRNDLRNEKSQAQVAPIYEEIDVVLKDVDAIQRAMDEMTDEADLIFSYLRENQSELAGQRMATMDRKYARVTTELALLHGDIGVIQKKFFDKQHAAAATLQKFEYAIAAFIFLMVSAAVAYGHKIKEQLELDTQKLELLVKERTTELEKANRGLRVEVAERKRAEEQFKSSNEKLRALSARLQFVREEEGTRIAREIHDELGRALTILIWELDGVAKVISESGDDQPRLRALQAKVEAMTGLIDATISTVRRISSELRPSVLDDLGLVEAIEWQAQQFQTRTGITCHCDCALEDVVLSKEQSTAVFRIFQEALTNVLRHAQATKIAVSVEKEAGEFVLTIRDNGRGITEEEKTGSQALGLLGMRERAHLVGGKIDIIGVRGKGTVVTVRAPTAVPAVARPRPSR